MKKKINILWLVAALFLMSCSMGSSYLGAASRAGVIAAFRTKIANMFRSKKKIRQLEQQRRLKEYRKNQKKELSPAEQELFKKSGSKNIKTLEQARAVAKTPEALAAVSGRAGLSDRLRAGMEQRRAAASRVPVTPPAPVASRSTSPTREAQLTSKLKKEMEAKRLADIQKKPAYLRTEQEHTALARSRNLIYKPKPQTTGFPVASRVPATFAAPKASPTKKRSSFRDLFRRKPQQKPQQKSPAQRAKEERKTIEKGVLERAKRGELSPRERETLEQMGTAGSQKVTTKLRDTVQARGTYVPSVSPGPRPLPPQSRYSRPQPQPQPIPGTLGQLLPKAPPLLSSPTPAPPLNR